ncbi:MAG: divalent metal cation transporter [Candidatus Nanopelagicales bacterium]
MSESSSGAASAVPSTVAANGTGRIPRWKMILAVFGPGLVVMLADTDAGSLITAAQSGAQWGYTLIMANLILIPIVFVVQELTIRLGILTGKGHGELIRDRFGIRWAWLSVGTLVLSCAGAIVSEMSGVAGVGLMWGIPEWASTSAVAVFLTLVVVTGSYKRVERIAISIGLFELVFVVTMFMSDPDPEQVAAGLTSFPISNPAYLFLVAANIGAVVMPWMIFYQQSAVVDKGLTTADITASRWDTAVGSVVTQLIMISMLVTCAATLWANNGTTDLNTVEQISEAITPYLGDFAGRVLFSVGITGAALVAAIVACLTAAWGLGELTGYKRTLETSAREAPWFYLVFVAVLLTGMIIVISGVNIIDLNIGIQVMNALLLPIVLGFLVALAFKALPDAYKLKGWYGWLIVVVATLTAGLGVYSGIAGIFGGGS